LVIKSDIKVSILNEDTVSLLDDLTIEDIINAGYLKKKKEESIMNSKNSNKMADSPQSEVTNLLIDINSSIEKDNNII